MNCQTFETIVVDLARSIPLEASARAAALAHSDNCIRCTQRLDQERLLTGGLQILATEMKSAVVADHVERNLISVLREQKFIAQAAPANSRGRSVAIAAAVLVAVAVGIAGYRMKPAAPVDMQTRTTPPAEVPLPTGSTPVVKELTEAPTVQRKPRSAVARKNRPRKLHRDVPAQSTFVTVVVGAVSDQETTEVFSPFMAVGYTNPANMQDGAQVVRVELPRYAMARFGLPINMERYDEHVKADVWLGTDGLARAIRFVQ